MPPPSAVASRTTANRVLANLLVLRGPGSAEAPAQYFHEKALYAGLNMDPVSLWTCSKRFRGHDANLTLLSNCQSVIPSLDAVTQKAWCMFSSRAYVHQYEKYGINPDAFVDSFVKIEQILKSYASLQ